MSKLIINAKALLKINTAMEYMNPFEVMGLGIIKKLSNKKYVLTDILFPPQENKTSFVTTKDDEYPKWFFDHIIKKEKQLAVRLHFHSHPNFGTTPSTTDVKQFEEFMEIVDDYMIQFIVSGNPNYLPNAILHEKENKHKTKMEIEYEYINSLQPILEKVTNVDISITDLTDLVEVTLDDKN